MDYVFKVESEWDIGLGGVVFASRERAEQEAKQALVDVGIDDPYDDLVGGGLVYVTPLPVR